jgi:hypothetical protein
VKVFGDGDMQIPAGVAGDSSGNAYVVGYYTGAVDFGAGVQLPSSALVDSFLVKLDPAGDAVWAHSFGQQSTRMGPNVENTVVAVDGSGNVLVGGPLENTISIGMTNPVSYTMMSGNADIFVAKLDPDGEHLWSRQTALTSTFTGVQGIGTDGAGNVYVAGYASGSGVDVFDSTTTSYSLWVAKLDGATGATAWVTLMPHSSNQASVYDLDVDDAGNVFVGGMFQALLTTGTSTLQGTGTEDILVVSLDTNGNIVWAGGYGGPAVQRAHGVALGTSGVARFAGVMRGSLDIDGHVLMPNQADLFLATFDASGNFIAVDATGENGNQTSNDMAAGPGGSFAVTGSFSMQLQNGPNDLEPVGQDDMFVLMYDGSGGLDWLFGFGSAAVDQGIGVAVDSAKRVTTVGYVEDDVVLGSEVLPHAGGRDIVVARFDP